MFLSGIKMCVYKVRTLLLKHNEGISYVAKYKNKILLGSLCHRRHIPLSSRGARFVKSFTLCDLSK